MGAIGVNELDKEDSIFIPERVVRSEEIEHGDKLIYEKNGIEYGRHIYTKLEVPKVKDIENNNIIEYDFAIVNYDDVLNDYIVSEYYEDGILKSIPSCIVHRKDINKFKIKKGDIVSIAHASDRNTGRIRWKYDSNVLILIPYKTKIHIKIHCLKISIW